MSARGEVQRRDRVGRGARRDPRAEAVGGDVGDRGSTWEGGTCIDWQVIACCAWPLWRQDRRIWRGRCHHSAMEAETRRIRVPAPRSTRIDDIVGPRDRIVWPAASKGAPVSVTGTWGGCLKDGGLLRIFKPAIKLPMCARATSSGLCWPGLQGHRI